MPSLLKNSDAQSRASHPSAQPTANNDVIVRVVTEQGRRRGRIGSFLSTLVIGALAVGMLLIAGVLTGVLPFANPFATATVDRSTPALLHEVSNLSTYSAAQGHFQQTIDVEHDVAVLPAFIAGERTTFLANGTVDATVNFSKLGPDAVKDAGSGAITVTLPEPKLATAVIDPKTSRVVGRDRGIVDRVTGMFNDTPTGEQRYYVMAQDKIGKAAKHSNLVARAERNTTTMLQGFLGKLGYSTVNVVFTPPTAASTAAHAA
jgi:hypothetical protein